uniref:Uncharacterized protein n=1 Tax=Glossina brevipalpis TaxID=37001 RepID=A0A1A9WWZ8_9MUSC
MPLNEQKEYFFLMVQVQFYSPQPFDAFFVEQFVFFDVYKKPLETGGQPDLTSTLREILTHHKSKFNVKVNK